jgi:hypothetical protein
VESQLAQSGPTEALVDQIGWIAADKVAATHTILKHGGLMALSSNPQGWRCRRGRDAITGGAAWTEALEIISRKGAKQFRVVVFDREKRLHFPLTVFCRGSKEATERQHRPVYLNAVIPFFEWLELQSGTVRSWDNPLEAVRQEVGDYLVERLKCRVREHYAGFQLVSLTEGTQTTVRVSCQLSSSSAGHADAGPVQVY